MKRFSCIQNQPLDAARDEKQIEQADKKKHTQTHIFNAASQPCLMAIITKQIQLHPTTATKHQTTAIKHHKNGGPTKKPISFV